MYTYRRGRGVQARRWQATIGCAAALLLAAATAAWAGTPPEPTYGSATVDGSSSEWNTAGPPGGDLFAAMYEAGNPDKEHLADLYLRYSCSQKRLYVLVLGRDLADHPIDPYAAAAWATIDGTPTKRFTGDSPPPAGSQFAWINQQPATDTRPATADGYEASFLIDPGSYTIVAHVEAWKYTTSWQGATVANMGFNTNQVEGTTPLTISCPIVDDPPSIAIDKYVNGADADVAPGPYVPVGDSVRWTYLVTNDGDMALDDVTVSDDQGVAVTCPKSQLAVGESMECTASGTAMAGPYVNIGAASGSPSGGGAPVTASDPAHHFGAAPAIAIVKKVNGDDANDEPGVRVPTTSTVSWTYEVKNTGNLALSEVSVADDRGVTVSCPAATLAPDETMTCTGSGTAEAGAYANLGSVTGTPPGNLPPVSASDPAHHYGMADLGASATVATSYTRTYGWAIAKAVSPQRIQQVGGSGTFAYAVTATQLSIVDSSWKVSGTITVSNPNGLQISGVSLTDSATGATNCSVDDAIGLTVPALGSIERQYQCTWASSPGSGLSNTVSATWDAVSNGTPTGSATATAPVTFGEPTTRTNQTITVADRFGTEAQATLGTLTATDTMPFTTKTYTYTRTLAVPKYDCQSYENVSRIVETDQRDTRTITLCGPARTAARTIGFWQNTNGQYIITSQAPSGVCPSGTWLRQYAPFQGLAAGSSCKQVASWVATTLKKASATGASMNDMVRAQMLATALDTYFSDSSLGGNKLTAPAPLGSAVIDLTKVCADIGTCSTYRSTSAAFGGATALAVNDLLQRASSASNVGGSIWYGNVKSTQELAKNTFDAINNEVVFRTI